MGFFFPGFVGSLHLISKELKKIEQSEAALLTMLRLRKEIVSTSILHLQAPQELWITNGNPPIIEQVIFENGVIRIHSGKTVYPITAPTDATSISFIREATSEVYFMQWDNLKLRLR